MNRCEDKVAIVTGGASGIGRACVEALVSEGARVLIADIADDRGAELAAGIGGSARYFHLDVRSEDGWRACMERCTEAWGKLDVLVNNAGVPKIQGGLTPETITLEEWRGVNAVNTEGVVLGCKHAIAAMRTSGGGSIVNLSSIGALMESPLAYPYGASKAAVLQITKTVAVYCAKNGYEIRCNAVLPGMIATEMLKSGASEEALRRGLRGVPIGRLGEPEQIANAVVFLASDEASYVTGTHFTIDGGISAANPMRASDPKPTD